MESSGGLRFGEKTLYDGGTICLGGGVLGNKGSSDFKRFFLICQKQLKGTQLVEGGGEVG